MLWKKQFFNEKKYYALSSLIQILRAYKLSFFLLRKPLPLIAAATAALFPPSTGALFPFCSTSRNINHPQSNFSLRRRRRFKPSLLSGCKKWWFYSSETLKISPGADMVV